MPYIVNSNNEWIWNEPEERLANVVTESIPPEPPAEIAAQGSWQNPKTDAQWKEWEYRKKHEIAGQALDKKAADEARWRADIKKDEKPPLPVIGDVPPGLPPEKDWGGGTTYRPAAATRKDGVRRFSNIASDAGDPTVGYINDKTPPVSYGGIDDEFPKFHQHVIDTQFDGKDPNLLNPYVEADKLADPKIEPERNKVILERLIKQKTADIAKLDYFDKQGLGNIERKRKAEEKKTETAEKEKDKFETGKAAAIKESVDLTTTVINTRAYLNQKVDAEGNAVTRTPEEKNDLNKTISLAEKRLKELDEKYKLSEQPEAAKTETLTPVQKETAKQLFAKKRAEGKDMATAMKEMKAEMGAAQAKPQIPDVSKPTVKPQIKPEIAPVIPAEPPDQAIKPNPNKARIISRPDPKTAGEAYQKRLLGPTPVEYEAANQELIDLASKLGVGPQNWKSLGRTAKAAGEGAWLMYTDAIGRALAGQRKARMELTGAE